VQTSLKSTDRSSAAIEILLQNDSMFAERKRCDVPAKRTGNLSALFMPILRRYLQRLYASLRCQRRLLHFVQLLINQQRQECEQKYS